MSFVQFLRILLVWRRAIIGCALLAVVAGGIYALVRPRTYTAEARVMLDVLKPDPVTGEAINSSFARAFVPTQTELIGDYRVTGRVVDKLGWMNDPAMRADFGGDASDPTTLRRWFADRISNRTDAANVMGSNIIDIGYQADDPASAARIANAVRDAYIEETLAAKRTDARQTAAFFERQLQDVRGKLGAAEARKAAFERANNVVLLADDSDADSARLQAMAGAAPPPPTVVGGTGGGGGGAAAAELATIDAKIASAQRTYGPNHPVIQALRADRQAAAAAAASEAASARASAGSVRITGGADIAGARASVLARREKVDEAKRLQSDVTVLRDQYTKMSARAADLQQQSATDESGISLLGSATEPSEPDPPSTIMIFAAALIAGAGLGVVLALGLELLRRRVRSTDDLSNTGVPVLAVINGGAATAAA